MVIGYYLNTMMYLSGHGDKNLDRGYGEGLVLI